MGATCFYIRKWAQKSQLASWAARSHFQKFRDNKFIGPFVEFILWCTLHHRPLWDVNYVGKDLSYDCAA